MRGAFHPFSSGCDLPNVNLVGGFVPALVIFADIQEYSGTVNEQFTFSVPKAVLRVAKGSGGRGGMSDMMISDVSVASRLVVEAEEVVALAKQADDLEGLEQEIAPATCSTNCILYQLNFARPHLTLGSRMRRSQPGSFYRANQVQGSVKPSSTDVDRLFGTKFPLSKTIKILRNHATLRSHDPCSRTT
jgi:hypothetical protein